MAESFYWIKLWLEILDDSKMGVMPDRLWRRCIELFMLAGAYGKGGELPETKQLAWRLRMNIDDLDLDMRQIEMVGIVKRLPNGGWLVVNFQKRQAPVQPKDRMKQMREKNKKQIYYEDVTDELRNVTQINRLTDNRLTEAEEGATTPTFIPQVNQLDYTRVFCKVTGMSCIPGSEIQKVLPALEALQVKYPQEQELIDYLIPFWQNWIKRRTKDGRLYSKTNCTWLYDWAVAGVIPENGNGSIPPAHKAAAEVI